MELNRERGSVFKGRLLRGAVVACPAALITVGLMQAMHAATTVDDFELPKDAQITLESFIMPDLEPEQINKRPPIKKLDLAETPPPMEKISISKQDVVLPAPVIIGQVPSDPTARGLGGIIPKSIAMSKEAIPLWLPVPTYPQRAIDRNIEGTCEVRMDLDTRGRPYNVTANCTDRIFKSPAERAVRKVEFSPRVIRGQAVEQHGVVYPLEFKLASE